MVERKLSIALLVTACASGMDADVGSATDPAEAGGASTDGGDGPRTTSEESDGSRPEHESSSEGSTSSSSGAAESDASSSGDPQACDACGCPVVGDPLAITCDGALVPNGEGQHTWGSSYANWSSASAGVRFEQSMRIVQPAFESFHTHQFGLVNASGGYIGVQTRNIGADGSIASHVRFSIWDTLAAEGEACTTFGGEGIGYTCVIDPYPVTFGMFYTLRIEQAAVEADGTWWEASVVENVTCEARTIGRIKVAHTGDDALVYSALNFSEYFGPRATDCMSVPQSIAEWTAPEITDAFGTSVADGFAGFTKAEPAEPCSEAGVEAWGEIDELDGDPLYRMVNGSVPICW